MRALQSGAKAQQYWPGRNSCRTASNMHPTENMFPKQLANQQPLPKKLAEIGALRMLPRVRRATFNHQVQVRHDFGHGPAGERWPHRVLGQAVGVDQGCRRAPVGVNVDNMPITTRQTSDAIENKAANTSLATRPSRTPEYHTGPAHAASKAIGGARHKMPPQQHRSTITMLTIKMGRKFYCQRCHQAEHPNHILLTPASLAHTLCDTRMRA